MNTVVPFSRQASYQFPDFASPDWVEPAHRLVHEHDFRIIYERLSQSNTLEHSLRVFSQLTIPCRLFEPDRGQKFFRSGFSIRLITE